MESITIHVSLTSLRKHTRKYNMDFKFKQPELKKKRVVIWEKLEHIQDFRDGMDEYVEGLTISQPFYNHRQSGYVLELEYHPDLSSIVNLQASLGKLHDMNHKIL